MNTETFSTTWQPPKNYGQMLSQAKKKLDKEDSKPYITKFLRQKLEQKAIEKEQRRQDQFDKIAERNKKRQELNKGLSELPAKEIRRFIAFAYQELERRKQEKNG